MLMVDMDDNTLSSSSSQLIDHPLFGNDEFDINNVFDPVLQPNNKYWHSSTKDGLKSKAIKHQSTPKLIRKNKNSYSRSYRKSTTYIKSLVRSILNRNKNDNLVENDSNKPLNSQNYEWTTLRNYGPNAISRDEFYRRISVIKSCYNVLPIIKSKKNQPVLNGVIQSLKDRNSPILIETSNGLDVKFNLAILIDILSCPLCKGLFYNAHTIKECMHTFCKSCLILSTIENGFVCPICFTVIRSDINEGIEYDRNIQGIVDKIFPEFIKEEKKQKKELDTFLGRSVSDEAVSNNTTGPLENARFYANCNLVDSTEEFLNQLVKQFDNLGSLFDNVLCLALIHEADHDLKAAINNPDKRLDAPSVSHSDIKKKYPRKYICVPKTVYVSHIMKYLYHELSLDLNCNIVFMIKNTILSKNHTLEFICKSRRIDMSKCVIFRYKVIIETPLITVS